MIRPVNGHILIEPLAHESFIASQKDIFEEIGVVVDCDDRFLNPPGMIPSPMFPSGSISIKKGDKVFFDSWLAARYPKNDHESYWLVRWDDVRAVEYAEQPIPAK